MEDLVVKLLPALPPLIGSLLALWMIAREIRMSIQTLVKAVAEWFSDNDGFAIPFRVHVTHVHRREVPVDERGRRARKRMRLVEDEPQDESDGLHDSSVDESSEPEPPRRRERR